uniref:Uncharacterized protein n=1 Tax=Arundo donax TaxID=35708 RepID=A0A0A8Z7Y5_ARUDO
MSCMMHLLRKLHLDGASGGGGDGSRSGGGDDAAEDYQVWLALAISALDHTWIVRGKQFQSGMGNLVKARL